MSVEDTQAPDDVQDKPDIDSAPDDGTSADVDNWKQSYDELRSKFNERDQEFAQLRQFRESLSDPGRQAEILREFGIELADDPTPQYEEDLDDVEALKREVESLKTNWSQEQTKRQQQEAYEAFVGDFTDQVEQIEQADGRELSDAEIKILFDRAEASLYRGEQNRVEDLYKDLKALRGDVESEIIESKKAPRVQSGRSASKQPDLDNEKERHDYLLARMFGQQNT